MACSRPRMLSGFALQQGRGEIDKHPVFPLSKPDRLVPVLPCGCCGEDVSKSLNLMYSFINPALERSVEAGAKAARKAKEPGPVAVTRYVGGVPVASCVMSARAHRSSRSVESQNTPKTKYRCR